MLNEGKPKIEDNEWKFHCIWWKKSEKPVVLKESPPV
jgi:hypothetical protein